MQGNECGQRKFRITANEYCGRCLFQNLCAGQSDMRSAIQKGNVRKCSGYLSVKFDSICESSRFYRKANIVRLVSAYDGHYLFRRAELVIQIHYQDLVSVHFEGGA